MNDRYLYKAKDKDDGKWYEGYYMCLHDTTYCSMPSDNVEEARKLEEENTHHYIVFERMTDWGLPNRHLRAEIDPTTLCACTGLKDKNGKLIWENDILMCHGNKKDLCKVCFGEFKVIDIGDMVAVDIVQGWYYKPLKTDTLSKCEPFCYEMPLTNYYLERMEAEVVGNILDNPELLEVEE